MKSRKLMTMTVLAVLVLPLLASCEDAADLDKYLDCLADKKVDIAFVFDTSNSMGGEINELRAIAKEFATGLEDSHIDYQLGLVEFRDFPKTCDGNSCGSPGDFAYQVKGNGTLTPDISTFSSWLRELSAGGGGSPGPEALLAALRHAGSDLTWRTDAEKVIILLTDAVPHPDGSCCNAEGDTLEGTIFGLTALGTRVYVIGPDDASVKKISKDTGGQFYEIQSGLSLRPLLEEITQSLDCSFNVMLESTCENEELNAKVQLVGKETIPYVAGQTEVWMYLDQAGSISRYNLSYDMAARAYRIEVPNVCGSVDLTVYGRIGERSAVMTGRVECASCGPGALTEQGMLSISGRVFNDTNGNGVKDTNEIGLEGWDVQLEETAGNIITAKTDRNGYYIFMGLLPGRYILEAVCSKDWTAIIPAEGVQVVELRDIHESEIDFGFESLLVSQLLNMSQHDIELDYLASLILPTPDNGYLLVSSEYEPLSNRFGGEATLIKINAEGYEQWKKVFIEAGYNFVSLQQTFDGNYILLCNQVLDFYDARLIKIDANGNEIWNRTYGGRLDDIVFSIEPTFDGGYILAGITDSFDATMGNDGAWLIKVDSEGNELWNRTLGGERNDFVNSVNATSDGGYILTGISRSFGSEGQNSFWLVKVDSEGNELWNRTLGEEAPWGYCDHCDRLSGSVQLTSDGGYIFTGLKEFNSNGKNDAWLVKIDSEGNTLWSNRFGGEDNDSAILIQPTSDGYYLLAGETESFSKGGSDAWLIKVDSEGNELWNKTFGGGNNDSVNSINPTSDGYYLLAGETESFSKGGSDAWLIKVDSEGNELWNKTFGGVNNDSAVHKVRGPFWSWGRILGGVKDDASNSIQPTYDDGYLFAAETESRTESYGIRKNTWLIRVDTNGNII